jgi:peptidoglycan/xylan/chitin deacetylase (PgdA/CDA1 family)
MSPPVQKLKRRLKRAARFAGSVVEVRTDQPYVVLTFDDGPDPTKTEVVLEALAARQAWATFFVLLSRARRHPEIVREVLAAGHEVALHGIDHRRLTRLPVREVYRRMVDGKRELEDLVGSEIRWFRSPYGAQGLTTWHAITRAGMTPVMWGPTLWDWKQVSVSERLEAATRGIHAGAILLGHDGFPGPEDGVDDGPRPVVDHAWLLRVVLDDYAAKRLVGRSLGEAVRDGIPVRQASFVR